MCWVILHYNISNLLECVNLLNNLLKYVLYNDGLSALVIVLLL
jgi:hypothetical protein